MGGYTKSDFISDIDGRISTSWNVIMSISGKGSNQSINKSWVHCRCVGCILILMLVIKLDVMPSNTMTLYYKDNGTIALAKESRSHQISKYIDQQNMRLPQVEIHRDAESKLYMRCG